MSRLNVFEHADYTLRRVASFCGGHVSPHVPIHRPYPSGVGRVEGMCRFLTHVLKASDVELEELRPKTNYETIYGTGLGGCYPAFKGEE